MSMSERSRKSVIWQADQGRISRSGGRGRPAVCPVQGEEDTRRWDELRLAWEVVHVIGPGAGGLGDDVDPGCAAAVCLPVLPRPGFGLGEDSHPSAGCCGERGDRQGPLVCLPGGVVPVQDEPEPPQSSAGPCRAPGRPCPVGQPYPAGADEEVRRGGIAVDEAAAIKERLVGGGRSRSPSGPRRSSGRGRCGWTGHAGGPRRAPGGRSRA